MITTSEPIRKNSSVFLAGHRGLVGSAILRNMRESGHTNILTKTRAELDLGDGQAVEEYFQSVRPEYVILAAAKVGGIVANDTYPVDFLVENLAIQNAVICAAEKVGVKRLLFLGSSCIYPKHAEQPLKEEALLTGPLEETNRSYALAKIAGVELCWSMNRQYGTSFLSVMPTNLYGQNDNYHPTNSHVIPGLIHRFHVAKSSGQDSVSIWGTGTPLREFLSSDDLAQAALHLLQLKGSVFDALCAKDRNGGPPPLVNIGSGQEVSIAELAEIISDVIGYSGSIEFEKSRPDGTPRKLLDSTKMRSLGWTPKTQLIEGIQRAYENYLAVVSNAN
jgi:GDP-L-fucose synthase